MRIAPSFICFCTLFIFLAKSFAQTTTITDDKSMIRQLEYDWLQAEFRLDTASISAMMDETFVAVAGAGLQNKQRELEGIYANMSHRKKINHTVDSLYLDDIRIEVYGATAVVTFISVTSGKISDVPFQDRRTRIYDVWIKREGNWKAVSSQATPLN